MSRLLIDDGTAGAVGSLEVNLLEFPWIEEVCLHNTV